MTALLDDAWIREVSVDAFTTRAPFPFVLIHELLRPEAFAALSAEFPPHALFAWHGGLPRVHGQRPHDRWYLAYEARPYADYDASEGGVAAKDQLPPVWQQLIEELQTNVPYRDMVAACLGTTELEVRFAWHKGVTDSEVSPHVDDERKAGTHIFYFNSDADWDPEWGGAVLVLGEPTTTSQAPDFDDFPAITEIPAFGNSSFLFRNQPGAWHGVRRLRCPDDRVRRLFNVIYEHSGMRSQPATRTRWRTVRGRTRR